MPFMGVEVRLGACVLTEFDANGFLRAQPQALGDDPRVESYELLQPYGFMARPAAAEVDADGRVIQGKACSLLYWSIGDRNFAMLASDPRPIALLPALAEGEQMIYGPAANFARCKVDGTVTLFTTDDGTYDGNSIYCQVSPTGFMAFTPWGTVKLGADGFHMRHSSGARMDAGSIGGLPSPLDALASYITLSAAMVQVEGSAIALGTETGSAEPAAKALQVVAAHAALSTAMTAEAAAFTALAAVGAIGAPAQAACTTAATALATAIATLATLATTIPSPSTSVT